MFKENQLDRDIVYYEKVYKEAQLNIKQRITFQGLDKTITQLKYLNKMLKRMRVNQ